MGVNDTIWFKFSCASCGISETCSINDTGQWNGAQWSNSAALNEFSVLWEGGAKNEPKPKKYFCKKCDKIATYESAYGVSEPHGF